MKTLYFAMVKGSHLLILGAVQNNLAKNQFYAKKQFHAKINFMLRINFMLKFNFMLRINFIIIIMTYYYTVGVYLAMFRRRTMNLS